MNRFFADSVWVFLDINSLDILANCFHELFGFCQSLGNCLGLEFQPICCIALVGGIVLKLKHFVDEGLLGVEVFQCLRKLVSGLLGVRMRLGKPID